MLQCKNTSVHTSKSDLNSAHKTKMLRKAAERDKQFHEWSTQEILSANVNRHTGKPHEHKREITRNLSRV
jgi:hypothetical protein